MKNAITDVPGIKVGHAQNLEAGTGCTIVLCEEGAVTAVDVRGGTPGTRETDCLYPPNLVSQAHAVYLSGGSAFGLDGAAGVMKYLEEKGIGFDTGVALVPIVPGAVLFDLIVGDPKVRPDGEMAYQACLGATADNTRQGNVGAGTGATVGKALGTEFCMKSGLGTASICRGSLIVGAIAAVNCFGDVIDPATGDIIAGTLSEDKSTFAGSLKIITEHPEKKAKGFPTNTTIGVIATNAVMDKAGALGALRVAMAAHDGFARTMNPAHTLFDGDTVFCMSTGTGLGAGAGKGESDLTAVCALAAEVMATAVINAVKKSTSLYGLPAAADIKRR